ncbi:hypothetical protein J8273_4617 [Carpediemonas membranifera]|uniref:Uncharacterized protein n=1 Tax=Carpediemonas membranifera TaxID=201153 RepID=A0A8J6BBN6_9EUKA|nr:hypothetical protein J8273_4617 [Carpediemonas membranifera]|eukprot:KAG9394017.1 hypothetical protein J8273_4617 [Carpediemonas membranifera]
MGDSDERMMLQLDSIIENLLQRRETLVHERKRIHLERKEVELNRKKFRMDQRRTSTANSSSSTGSYRPKPMLQTSPTSSKGSAFSANSTSPLQLAIESAHEEIRQFRSVLSNQVRTVRLLGEYSLDPASSGTLGRTRESDSSLLSNLPSVTAVSSPTMSMSITQTPVL